MSEQSTAGFRKKNRSNKNGTGSPQVDESLVSSDTAPVIPVDLEMEELPSEPQLGETALETEPNGHYDAPAAKPVLESVPAAQPIYTAPAVQPVISPAAVAVAQPSVYTDVVSFLRVILVNGWIILLMAALGAGGAYLYAKTEPKIYETTTTVYVAISTSDVSSEAGLLNILKANMVGNYVQILKSQDYTITPTFAELAKRYDEKLIKKALIDVIPVANSTMITILVDSTDPDLARDMANTIADQAIKNSPPEFSTVFPLKVLDKAHDPGDPISPQTRLMVMMGGAGAAVAGIAIAFFLDGYVKYRRSLKSAGNPANAARKIRVPGRNQA